MYGGCKIPRHPRLIVWSVTGRWFPPGTRVYSTKKLISSSFHRLDMTLAVAEALNPNKPNFNRLFLNIGLLGGGALRTNFLWYSVSGIVSLGAPHYYNYDVSMVTFMATQWNCVATSSVNYTNVDKCVLWFIVKINNAIFAWFQQQWSPFNWKKGETYTTPCQYE